MKSRARWIVAVVVLLAGVTAWRVFLPGQHDVCIHTAAADKSLVYGFFAPDGNCSVTKVLFFPADDRPMVPIHRQVRDRDGFRVHVGSISARSYLDAWDAFRRCGAFAVGFTNAPQDREGVFLFRFARGPADYQYFLIPLSLAPTSGVFQAMGPILDSLTNGVEWTTVTNELFPTDVSSYLH